MQTCDKCEESLVTMLLKSAEADKERAERSAKRMYAIAIVELIVIFAMLLGICYFVKTSNITISDVWQSADTGDVQYIGGDYNGATEGTDSYISPEESITGEAERASNESP